MSETSAVIETVWRMESAKIIATLARLTGDIGVAEDLAQDALLAALKQWPDAGVPRNPAAWLVATAKHRVLDHHRRSAMVARKHDEIVQEMEPHTSHEEELDTALDDHIGDDLLRLVFTACHPLLSAEARVALTLRLLGGLTTAEIARAYLTAEPTIAQRIVRAKRTLSAAQVPFEVPRGAELQQRLASVLEVIYLIFNEGYSATAGDDLMRPQLVEEALRLGRVLAGLMPEEAEVHGLVALMEIQASRMRARTGPRGEPVLLLDQDRARWDYILIGRGLAALARAEQLGGAFGPYTLQAGIAACHACARTAEATDWERIAALYDALSATIASPVVELNRAVAVAMAYGPAEGLALLAQLEQEPLLKSYHLLPAARADMLEKLGRREEAAASFIQAAELTHNERERALLRARAEACRDRAH